jgi:hypothetical protein
VISDDDLRADVALLRIRGVFSLLELLAARAGRPLTMTHPILDRDPDTFDVDESGVTLNFDDDGVAYAWQSRPRRL